MPFTRKDGIIRKTGITAETLIAALYPFSIGLVVWDGMVGTTPTITLYKADTSTAVLTLTVPGTSGTPVEVGPFPKPFVGGLYGACSTEGTLQIYLT